MEYEKYLKENIKKTKEKQTHIYKEQVGVCLRRGHEWVKKTNTAKRSLISDIFVC